jgi:SecD/SecF fusion protein
MQNKGLIRIFAILLSLACAFYLSFTWITVNIEDDARLSAEEYISKPAIKELASNYSQGQAGKELFFLDSVKAQRTQRYLDSMKTEKVFLGFTYLECKEKEINLGLDLKVGMNVTLEVSIPDIIRGMSSRPDDKKLNEAIANALEKEKKDTRDFVTIFGEELKKSDPSNNISFYFRTIELKGKVDANTKDEEVLGLIRETVESSIKVAEKTLRARIDRFGVTQPNIQQLEASGRILIELPGITEKERVRKLLQGSANLEFWETFDNKGEGKDKGVALMLIDANTEVKKILNPVLADTTAGDTTKKDNKIVDKKVAEDVKTTQTDTTKKDSVSLSNLLGTGESKSDSLLTANDSLENFKKENPLFYVLKLNLDQQGAPYEGPICGFANVKDTAEVMFYLTREKVARVLPPNIRFMWGNKALKGFLPNYLPLYAIKVSDRNGKAALFGDIITRARVEFDQSNKGNASVSMSMTDEAASTWATLTKANKGKAIAIVLDNLVYSAPNVMNEITGGQSSITGDFSLNEAEDLANILSAGKLPASAKIVEESIVGPTLGKESIKSGLISFIIALLIVLAFMAFYYGRAGLVADVALFANMFFIMGVLASFGAVLTLPGIAGIVLVIGMSVDANILVFERIREELRNGKGISLAIKDGYAGALSSILDSNITTMILGIILAVYGTGPVQGFAVTLIIGICSSLFCALFLTRMIFETMLKKSGNISFANTMTQNAFKNIQINFVGNRKYYYILSALIIGAGTFMYFKKGGFNLGVDFKGGRSYVVRFDKPISPETVIKTLTGSFGGEKPEVKTYGSSNQLKITTTYLIAESSEEAEALVETKLNEGLSSAATDNPYSIESQTKVGETISRDIRNASVWTVAFSCIVMFLYILLRFKKWQYGLGATVAVVHDVALVLSVYLIFDGLLPFTLEIDQHFIAAILTVIGYSMTDTVVVFDRVREFLTGQNKKDVVGEERRNLINYALNATLSRTMITSLTTFFVLLTIFIFGSEVIRGFTFALLVGIIIGTYSSLCIASPVVVDLDKKGKSEN